MKKSPVVFWNFYAVMALIMVVTVVSSYLVMEHPWTPGRISLQNTSPFGFGIAAPLRWEECILEKIEALNLSPPRFNAFSYGATRRLDISRGEEWDFSPSGPGLALARHRPDQPDAVAGEWRCP